MDEEWASVFNSKELSEWLRIDMRRIQQLTQEGILSTVNSGRNKEYLLKQAVREYIEYLQGNTAKKKISSKEAEERKLEAETRYKEAIAETAEIKLKELQGTMHRAQDVEDVTTDMVYQIKGEVMALPGRLAMNVANKNAAEASDIIAEEVGKMLEHFTDYQYDREAYKKRVREREGWRDDPDEPEES